MIDIYITSVHSIFLIYVNITDAYKYYKSHKLITKYIDICSGFRSNFHFKLILLQQFYLN